MTVGDGKSRFTRAGRKHTQFERRAGAVAKHVDRALQRVVPEHLPTHGREPLDTFAKIHRFSRQKNPALGGQLEHERPSTKARTTASSDRGDAGVWMHSRVPSGRDSSIWIPAGAGGQAGVEGTSTKPRDREANAGSAA